MACTLGPPFARIKNPWDILTDEEHFLDTDTCLTTMKSDDVVGGSARWLKSNRFPPDLLTLG